jgi:hypothetical protein
MSIDGVDPLAQSWEVVTQSESRPGLRRDWTTGCYVAGGDDD